MIRCLASAATVSGAGLSASPIIASWWKASTIVVASSAAQTTTLHGRTAAMKGSAVSASWASFVVRV